MKVSEMSLTAFYVTVMGVEADEVEAYSLDLIKNADHRELLAFKTDELILDGKIEEDDGVEKVMAIEDLVVRLNRYHVVRNKLENWMTDVIQIAYFNPMVVKLILEFKRLAAEGFKDLDQAFMFSVILDALDKANDPYTDLS